MFAQRVPMDTKALGRKHLIALRFIQRLQQQPLLRSQLLARFGDYVVNATTDKDITSCTAR
jgi:hypothetical protein